MRTIHLATPHGHSIYTVFCEVAIKIEVGGGRKKEGGAGGEEREGNNPLHESLP
jgi:hypothetical protein